jgi:catalase
LWVIERVSEPVLARAFEYWRNIDQAVGDRIAEGIGQRMAAEQLV